MISCGEPSGDLYAGALAVEIRRRQPDAVIFGFGGQRLMAGGGELVADYRGLSVTGLVEALRVLPKSFSVLNRLVEVARTEKPNALVVIDFPDFNFRLASAVKRFGIPIIYYISPQLWAWRRSRMRVMKRLADRVLVIFPFEEQIYRRRGRARAVRWPPAGRSGSGARAERSVSAGARARREPAGRRPAAGQPSKRSRTPSPGGARCGRPHSRPVARGAVRDRASAGARRSSVFEHEMEWRPADRSAGED